MGFRDRFRRSSRSPGGSRIYRHDHIGGPKVAVTRPFSSEREQAYDRLFGTCEYVYHETIPLVPHVDVYIYGPSKRPFYTLVTGGLSDLPMWVPHEVGSEGARAELVLYADEPKDEYLELLRRLAHMPHDLKTWFGYWHTVAVTGEPGPLFPESQLTSLLLMPSVVTGDHALRDELVLDGDPVNLLWVVPITAAETEYKLARGSDALVDLFDRQRLPFLLDERRQSVV